MGRFLHRGMVNSPDVVDKLLEGLSLGRGMDLGCGDGFYCEPLLRYVLELYCVDANEANVELVKSKFGGRVKAMRALAEELPFDDSSFDLVFMANSFHDFDRERAKAEVNRVLRQGGYIAIYDWKKNYIGPGPPPWIRMSEEDYLRTFERYQLVKRLDFGEHHYGLLLRKL
jgi:SAM-dependent methyltransferase